MSNLHKRKIGNCSQKNARAQTELRKDELKQLLRKQMAILFKTRRDLKSEIRERRYIEEQLRRLASELSLSEERERRKLALAVHDRIGQNLAAAKIKLQTLRQHAQPDMDLNLESIQQCIESSIRDTRNIVTELSPPVLDELGLLPALQRLAEDVQHQHGIVVGYKQNTQFTPDLNRDIQVLLFQMTRELLWNAVKHAQASHILILFNAHQEYAGRQSRSVRYWVEVGVEDDGIGFDPGIKAFTDYQSGGFGLFSIRERLRPLGGNLRIQSGLGTGTRACIEMNLHQSIENSEIPSPAGFATKGSAVTGLLDKH